MAFNTSGPAQLGADNVVRFADIEHFLRELAGNLGRGRAFVKSKRKFEIQSQVSVRIEAPGVAWGVPAEAKVVFARDGFVGLEFEDFESNVLPKLDMLGEEASRSANESVAAASERTVIAPMNLPDLDDSHHSDQGAAMVEFSEEEERTGHMMVPPGLRASGVRGGGSIEVVEQTRDDPPETPPPRPAPPPPLPRRRPPPAIPDAATVHDPGIGESLRSAPPPSTRGPRVRRNDGAREVDHLESATMRLKEAESRPAPRREVKREVNREPVREPVRDAKREARALEAQFEASTREVEMPLPPSAPKRTDPSDRETVDREVGEPFERADTPLAAEPVPPMPPVIMPPAPATTIPSFGVDAPDFKALPLLRASAAGVIRTNDLATLLGAYLSQLRHGHMTVHGGPDGELGQHVKLKFPGAKVAVLDAEILARVGDWVTLKITDAAAVRDALVAQAESLHAELSQILGTVPSEEEEEEELELDEEDEDEDEHAYQEIRAEQDAEDARTAAELVREEPTPLPPPVIEPPPPPPLPPPAPRAMPIPKTPTAELLKPKHPTGEVLKPKLPPPPPPPDLHRPTTDDLHIVREAASPSTEDLEPIMALPPANTPPPAPVREHVTGGMAKLEEPKDLAESDDAPPKPPKLYGDVVIFARVKDLRHEIDANLKNGGLFVESAPLALRTHKSMRVQIATVATDVKIEADVVFAAGGRVGFSVVSPVEARAALERAIETLGSPQPVSAQEPQVSQTPSPVQQTPSPFQHTPAMFMPSTSPTADLAFVAPSEPAPAEVVPATSFSGKFTRIPTHVELLDLITKRAKNSGELANSTVFFAFELVTRTGGRGVLAVRAPDRRETIYVHEGSVAFIESQPFDEELSLGRMLIAAKRITEPALREGLERAKQQKRPLGRTLVALGSITKKVLVEQLREQTRAKLEASFYWKDGTYEWGPWREPPGDADLVLTKGIGIIARHIKNRFETLGVGEIETMFGKNMNRIVIPTGAVEQMIEQIGPAIGLGQKELRFLELSMQGERTIADVVTGSPLGRLGSLRLIAAGLALGMMAFRDGRIATFVGPVRPKSEVTDSPQQVQLKRELKERLALFKAQNHFEVLGVHWSQHYRAYRLAYDKLRRELDLTRGLLRDAPQETTDTAKELLKIVEKAYTTLSDERGRVSYRNQFFDKTERQYSADMLVKQGEVALMRGDRVGAIEALETAVELDPSARNRQLLAGAREGKSV